MTAALTWVGREQGAALAVNDLLNDGHVLRDGRGHNAKAWHHGVHGGDARHHAEAGVKICRGGGGEVIKTRLTSTNTFI